MNNITSFTYQLYSFWCKKWIKSKGAAVYISWNKTATIGISSSSDEIIEASSTAAIKSSDIAIASLESVFEISLVSLEM
jgi:hypothetical protein